MAVFKFLSIMSLFISVNIFAGTINIEDDLKGLIKLSQTPIATPGHGDAPSNIYINQTGIPTFKRFSDKKSYPVGTVIVAAELSFKNKLLTEASSIRMMKKQKPGFNPAAGDWEFLISRFDLKKKNQSVVFKGKLEKCISCHISKIKTDLISSDKIINKVH